MQKISYICQKSFFVQRKFIINLGLLLLLNFLIKPFWIFGIDRTVQNTIPTADYGTYFALFNFSLLFNILLDLGITNYNNRNIAQNHHLLTKYFSGIVVFKCLLAIVYLGTTFMVGAIMGYDSNRFYILLFLSINQFLISFIQYLRSNIAGLQLFMLDSLFSVLDKTLMIIFCSILLWGHFIQVEFNLMQFIYGQTLAYLIAAIVLFITVYAKTKKLTFKVNLPFLLLILKQTAPYALLVLTMTFYYRLDVIMLDYMLPDGEIQAAIYAQAYRLMDASNQMGVLFAGLLLPMFAYMIKDKKKLDKLVKLSFTLLFIPAIVLALLCFAYSSEIMNGLYGENTAASSGVLPVLMFCFVAIASTYIFGTLLTANGNLKQLNILAICGMSLNLILNIILIPTFKAFGSAIASLITQFLMVLIQVFLAKKIFNFYVNYRFVVAILGYVLLLVGAIYLMQKNDIQLVSGAVVFVSFAVVLGIVLRVIKPKEMISLLMNRGVEE